MLIKTLNSSYDTGFATQLPCCVSDTTLPTDATLPSTLCFGVPPCAPPPNRRRSRPPLPRNDTTLPAGHATHSPACAPPQGDAQKPCTGPHAVHCGRPLVCWGAVHCGWPWSGAAAAAGGSCPQLQLPRFPPRFGRVRAML